MRTEKILFTLIILINVSLTFAQTDSVPVKHKIFLSVSGGIVMPTRNFALYERDYTKSTGIHLDGGAGIGFNGRIEAQYLFSRNFGLLFSLFSTVNKTYPVEYDVLFPQLSAPASGGGSVTTSYIYAAKKWYTNNLLLGLSYHLRKDITTFSIRLSAGCQHVQSPYVETNETGYNWQWNWQTTHPWSQKLVQSKITSYCLVFDGGMNVRFQLKNRTGIILGFDYLVSRPEFRGSIFYSYDISDGTTSTHNEGNSPIVYDKTVTMYCLNFGISYAIK